MRSPLSPRIHCALVAMLAVAAVASPAAAQDKLDRALRDGKQSGKSQRVILKPREGYEALARQLLEAQGKNVDGELPGIGALTAELSASELDLCNNPAFEVCSEDALVAPSMSSGRSKAKTSALANPVVA